jgi:hypothetical protein
VVLLLVCGGCKVTIATDVEAHADGSGVIRVGVGLDREALTEVPDLAEQLRTDDLRAAGWQIRGPQREADGLTWIRANYRFTSPDDAQRALGQLNGPEGPFREFVVRREHTLFRDRVSVAGLVDLGSGLAGFADAELERRLGDANPGVDPATLKQRYGVDLADLVDVRVSAQLPGLTRSWDPRVGDPPLRLEASSVSWNKATIAFTGLSAIALALGVALVVRGRRTVAPPA